MFWIQEMGSKNNNSAYRLFYAEYESDISLLPTSQTQGQQSNGDTVANQKCALGSECLCIDTGDVFVLTTSGWQLI